MKTDRHWRTPFRTRSGVAWGSSIDHPEAAQRLRTDPPADVGIYLDRRWRDRPARRKYLIDWPDYGLPEDGAALLAALDVAREALRAGGTVEIGCFTGRGRAGTTLACLAVLDGESAADAIAHVRAGYCRQAIETSEQEAFVAETAERVRARS